MPLGVPLDAVLYWEGDPAWFTGGAAAALSQGAGSGRRGGRGSGPQPDIHLRILPEYGGQSQVEKDLCVSAPELAAEIAGSSAALDLGPKRDLYAAAGVREYIVVLIEQERVLWLRLEGGVYREIAPDADGILRSQVFSGLWLDPKALLSDDAAGDVVVPVAVM